MHLKCKRAKGNKYIYLYSYDGYERERKSPKSISVCSFGRNDKALKKLKEWKDDFNSFPRPLRELGCTKGDLLEWIITVETGVTKTGKRFNGAV